MPAFDIEDNDNNFSLTYFDECKLEDMDINEIVEGEAGNFMVKKVSKNQYDLFLRNEMLIRKHQKLQITFPSLKRLLAFLKK